MTTAVPKRAVGQTIGGAKTLRCMLLLWRRLDACCVTSWIPPDCAWLHLHHGMRLQAATLLRSHRSAERL